MNSSHFDLIPFLFLLRIWLSHIFFHLNILFLQAVMATDSTPTVVPSPTLVMAPMTVSHGEKQENFNGTEFKRWQQKMLFYLTTLNLACFLQEDVPALKENENDKQVVAAVEAWKLANFLCSNYILNGLGNTLYNVYCAFDTARELWESLDKEYKIEDARSL